MAERTNPSSSSKPKPARVARPEAPPLVVNDQPINQPLLEDDFVMMPAPDPSAFVSTARFKRPATPSKSLFARRTIVPLLLTHGLLLLTLGGLWFLTDEDSIYRPLGAGTALAMIAGGAILLALGILNVLHLQRALKSSPG